MDALSVIEGLDCSVCLERLDETCKVLPCQHTFCKGCLKAIVASRQELRCPECRRLVTENVDELPGNIMLIRLLDGIKDRQTRKHIASSTRSKIPFDEPCARAKYSYDAREAGDLNLKKGDLVVLLQRIDENWFIGEISGQQGYLPANFVEHFNRISLLCGEAWCLVINPLPKFEEIKRALARGLYDFEEDDEEELLHFKQGDIITVLQRVDANWCEGEIGDRCGIFPVNFVELNRAASSMVSTNKNPEPETRRQPSIPQTTSEIRQPRQKAQLHRPLRRSRSIPRENLETIRRRVRDFGETSDSNGHEGRVLNQINRHSFDAFSVEHSHDFSLRDESCDATSNVAANCRPNTRPTESRELQEDRSVSTSTTINRSSPIGFQTRDAKTSELYIALYNYRPQKNDELGLSSGEHYKVLEKGADGWFKGFPVLGRQQVGHFPGNYVRPVRSYANQENNTDHNAMPLIQRRRHKNNSQSSLNPDAAFLVVPRPRPFSDISNDSNQDLSISPPLTPPLVGAKPPKQSLFRRLSIGKKKDRSSPQTVQGSNQQTDTTVPTSSSSSSSRTTQVTASSSRTRMDSRQGSRNCPSGKEKYVVIASYPPHSAMELEIKFGDIVYVTRKTENGWYHGTLERNGKVGFVPSSFLQKI